MPAVTRAAHLPPLKRVGHKGVAPPGNTYDGFRRALAMGVDMIEFDVLPRADGTLVLAHDPRDALRPDAIPLADGLDHFADEAYASVELDVDLKAPGYEREVVTGLADRGLLDRSIVSSTYLETLDRVAALAPGLRRGWSVPRARRDYTRSPLAPAAYVLMRLLRLHLPRRAAALLHAGRCDAVMAHWLLVSERLVEAVRAASGQLYVWTVDDRSRIARLSALGVDAVITNDPTLFHPFVEAGS